MIVFKLKSANNLVLSIKLNMFILDCEFKTLQPPQKFWVDEMVCKVLGVKREMVSTITSSRMLMLTSSRMKDYAGIPI